MAGFIAVHTGAGNYIDETKYQRTIKESCILATDILKNGGCAMDACEAAIMCLENCGNTNAGFGSNLCWDGSIQCDASIMNGTTLHFGACTNVSCVKNPIQLARLLCDGQSKTLSMERIPPMIMAGEGAEQYAKEMGCTLVNAKDMISSKAEFTYNHYREKLTKLEEYNASTASSDDNDESAISTNNVYNVPALDTVGAICVDVSGCTAAGCSSGGILLKVPGRIGQAAVYGAGCWATNNDDLCVATCTTGNGEYLIKTLLAKELCHDLINNDCPVTSIHKTFKQKFLDSPFLPDKELYAGALSLKYDPKSLSGEVLWSHTTKSFCVGYMSTQQKTPKFVYSPMPRYSVPGKSSLVSGQHFQLRI